jgi:hypothetical protein
MQVVCSFFERDKNMADVAFLLVLMIATMVTFILEHHG